MKRRTFVLGALGAARLASGRERTDGLIGALRAGGGWASRLDDPAYGGRGDGTTLNDGPLLQALTDMPPEGGTLVIPPAGSWLFDAVDLAQVPRSGVVLVATGAQLVKATRTNTHMFRDEVGRSPGLTVVGGTFDLSAASFQPGDTVSAFFMVRSDDITFVDVTVRDGIEEGLKLYKPRRLRVRGGRFERLVNNGIQIHAPAADGFKGNAPDRNSEDVVVEGVAFQSVDDGLHGMEGQGVSVSADSPDTINDPRHPRDSGVRGGGARAVRLRGNLRGGAGGRGQRDRRTPCGSSRPHAVRNPSAASGGTDPAPKRGAWGHDTPPRDGRTDRAREEHRRADLTPRPKGPLAQPSDPTATA